MARDSWHVEGVAYMAAASTPRFAETRTPPEPEFWTAAKSRSLIAHIAPCSTCIVNSGPKMQRMDNSGKSDAKVGRQESELWDVRLRYTDGGRPVAARPEPRQVRPATYRRLHQHATMYPRCASSRPKLELGEGWWPNPASPTSTTANCNWHRTERSRAEAVAPAEILVEDPTAEVARRFRP